MQSKSASEVQPFSLTPIVLAAANSTPDLEKNTLLSMLRLTWSLLSPAQKAVFPVLFEMGELAAQCAPLRVPAPTRAQWAEVFGEEGENPQLPRAMWQDELQDEDTHEQDYWAWVVGSYPAVWGLNCDGIERKPLGRPLTAGFGRSLLKRAA